MSHGAHPALAAKPKPKLAPKIEVNSELLAYAHVSKAWPFEEARKVLSRLKRLPRADRRNHLRDRLRPFGSSAFGTFGEVARTTLVRRAFHVLSEDKSRRG